MSTSEVVLLDRYRSRRADRLRTAQALSRWRSDRASRVDAMVRALEIAGGDRAVTAWIDDVGEGSLRIDHIVDLGSDGPRRSIAHDVIELAYAHGVPGLGDLPDRGPTGVLIVPDSPASAAVVAIGSDGLKSWFLIVDSLTPRPRLERSQREALMFLGGELAAVLLDRDAGRLQDADGFESTRSESFAGWGVLGDIAEGVTSDAERDLVNTRFLTARLLQCHLDEGLATDRPGFAEQVSQLRSDLGRLDPAVVGSGEEIAETLALLAALERGQLPDAAERVLDRGRSLENAGFLHAAREFYLTAHEMATQCQIPQIAVDAAWGLGRASRRAADWPGAFRWYGIARDVSGSLGLLARHGRVLDGLANTYRDRGNLPGAREQVASALAVSERTGDEALRSSALHTSMTIEKLAGEHETAIVHGWESIQIQEDPERRLWALMDLGGVFLESGRFEPAENAFSVVADSVSDRDALVLALNGYAHVAAARGDQAEYEARWRAVEGAGWLKASAIIRGQVMFDRGLAWKELERVEEARDWLGLALSFGENQGVGKLTLDAERELAGLAEESHGHRAQRNMATPDERDRRVQRVCEGLASMRDAVPMSVV